MSVNSLPENEVSSLKTKDSVVYRVVLTGGKTREWTLRETLTLSFKLISLSSLIIILFHCFFFSGPCAGKTTALARFRTFFENLGWKV